MDYKYQFSVTTGTIFHDSHLSLTKWFLTIYLICSAKKGVSARQLQRELAVSYKPRGMWPTVSGLLCRKIPSSVPSSSGSLKLTRLMSVANDQGHAAAEPPIKFQ
jgi:hypothetical protein